MAMRTAATASAVVRPAISIIRRTRANNAACSCGGSGATISVMQGSSLEQGSSSISGQKLEGTVAGDEGSILLDRERAGHLQELERPRVVHRLDKDTTGLLVAAKNDRAHKSLTEQFADHGRTGAMRRGYMAFVWGVPNRQSGTVHAPIDRHPHAREKMAVRNSGREAGTHLELQESFNSRDGKPGASPLAFQLEA